MEYLGSKEALKAMCRGRIAQLKKQGYSLDQDALNAELDALPDKYEPILAFADRLHKLPYRGGFDYQEPDSLEEIRRCRPPAQEDMGTPPALHAEELNDKVRGGVYGRTAACMLGKPFEMGWQASNIREYLEKAGAYPLRDYAPAYSPYSWLATDTEASCREYIAYAQADDDITYFALCLELLERYGGDFTTQDVAALWLARLPYLKTWGPEHSIYIRMAAWRIWHENPLPQGEEWDRLTAYMNDGEEVIGAMIRGDAFGLACPGRPERAAELAWRDGMLTHRKTGLYAEMWVAATLAAAFYTRNPVTAIRQGLDQIPENSRYAEAIRQALEISVSAPSWEEAYPEIDRRWGALGHAGTFNETAAIINALVHAVDTHGLVDYEKAICATVMHGWDTDCSAATCGCIAGVLAGYHAIPEKWIAPLHDTFYTFKTGERDHRISAFAQRFVHLAERKI